MENSHGSERDLIEQYFHKGLKNKEIVLMLEKYHGIEISIRTLKRRLQDFGLKRRQQFYDDHDLEYVKTVIEREIANGPDSLNGYRTMWHVLRLRYHIHVPRHTVESILRTVDPRGVEERKQRCFRRRCFVSPGPNFSWHMDGYDKLKPYGFSIHGCVDGFSRRVLWLEVQKSNKNPKVISQYFLSYITASQGCPVRLTTDLGTENGIAAGMQCYLRSEDTDEYAGSNAHKYVKSTSNQRIECFWSSFRKLRSSWWIDFFSDLKESDLLDLTNEVHVQALWFCFAGLIQEDLDKAREWWNSHRIRKSKYARVSGIPDMMYFLPEEFGSADRLRPVSRRKLSELESRFQNAVQDEEDQVWEDYFIYVMERNNFFRPTTIKEAGTLFQKLVSFAKAQ